MVVVGGRVQLVFAHGSGHCGGETDSASILSALNLVHHLKQSNRLKAGPGSRLYVDEVHCSCTSLEEKGQLGRVPQIQYVQTKLQLSQSQSSDPTVYTLPA